MQQICGRSADRSADLTHSTAHFGAFFFSIAEECIGSFALCTKALVCTSRFPRPPAQKKTRRNQSAGGEAKSISSLRRAEGNRSVQSSESRLAISCVPSVPSSIPFEAHNHSINPLLIPFLSIMVSDAGGP